MISSILIKKIQKINFRNIIYSNTNKSNNNYLFNISKSIFYFNKIIFVSINHLLKKQTNHLKKI